MSHRKIALFTGSRAEYGLLRPVLHALESSADLEVRLIAGGSHLIGDEPTIEEIRSRHVVDAEVQMQVEGERTRKSDADAVSRGIRSMNDALTAMEPDLLLLLGDRIEVLAAATSASLLGIRIGHLHGGDVATGVCDDSIRHAVTKMAHLHFPATESSAARILQMGERPEVVFVVGSPAIDGIDRIPAMSDEQWNRIGSPRFVILQHPVGDPDEVEFDRMAEIISTVQSRGSTLLLAPNLDPGGEGIRRAVERSDLPDLGHLDRRSFIGMLKRKPILVGNSSAGLIECAALGTPSVDIGDRQSGRERPSTSIHVPRLTGPELDSALERALMRTGCPVDERFGSGNSAKRITEVLSSVALDQVPIRKRWVDSAPD